VSLNPNPGISVHDAAAAVGMQPAELGIVFTLLLVAVPQLADVPEARGDPVVHHVETPAFVAKLAVANDHEINDGVLNLVAALTRMIPSRAQCSWRWRLGIHEACMSEVTCPNGSQLHRPRTVFMSVLTRGHGSFLQPRIPQPSLP